MANKTPANPVTKKLIGEMFGGEGKEAREAARAEAGESAASAAAEETAERVGSILDEVAVGPAEDKPAEEKPAAEAKPEGETEPAKPAAEAKPAETPAGEKPKPAEGEPTVPTWALVAERKEKADLLKEKQRLETELAAAKAKPAVETKPKEAEDPEPDKVRHPIEHDEWENRQIRHDIAALRVENAQIKKVQTEEVQLRQIAEETVKFDRLVAAHREVYARESPEFNDKREFVRRAMLKQFEKVGLPPQLRHLTPEKAVDELEREMIGVVLSDPQYNGNPRAPFQRIEGLAESYGWEYYKQVQGAKPNGNGNGGKPAPKTDVERVAAGTKLADAARTTTTMPGTSPKAPADTDAMTAEKFAALTPAARRAYKKQHPDALEKLMGGEENESTIF